MNDRCNRFEKTIIKDGEVIVFPRCKDCKYKGNCSIELDFINNGEETNNELQKN